MWGFGVPCPLAKEMEDFSQQEAMVQDEATGSSGGRVGDPAAGRGSGPSLQSPRRAVDPRAPRRGDAS